MNTFENIHAVEFHPNSLKLVTDGWVEYDSELQIPPPEARLCSQSQGKIYERIAPLACIIFGIHTYDVRFFNPKTEKGLRVKLLTFGHHLEFEEVVTNKTPRRFSMPQSANDKYWKIVSPS